MWTFIIAGVVYLIGVGVVLVIRPSYMFTPDGGWKEFGIGKNDTKYTAFPFWLFCITWALVSYVIVLSFTNSDTSLSESVVNRKRNLATNATPPLETEAVSFEENTDRLKRGYYILNKKATKLSGVPKYVYLGETEPAD